MAQPEYKAGKIQLVRGVEIDDNLSISFGSTSVTLI